MQSILLISHGGMAAGVKDSLTMFFGKQLPQFETLSLTSDMGADQFGDQLKEKVNELSLIPWMSRIFNLKKKKN